MPENNKTGNEDVSLAYGNSKLKDAPAPEKKILVDNYDEMGKFIILNIQGKECRVPNLDYVNKLEQTIVKQQSKIDNLTTKCNRLERAIGVIGQRIGRGGRID